MEKPRISLDHGAGGKASEELVKNIFLPRIGNPYLNLLNDGAVLDIKNGRIAFSTDTFTVTPTFFPGGDIGGLAVCGTVNDLSMCGAKPLYLSAGFVLEEGFLLEDLIRIVESMRDKAEMAGVSIVTGDTKVVPRGAADGIFICTSGIGMVPDGVDVSPKNVEPGDSILLSGPIAEHGLSVLLCRENLDFSSPILSDAAPLNGLVSNMLKECPHIHAMRDPTRGGVASALNEIAVQAGVEILLEENSIPVQDAVRAACELLGLDPFYIACEGRLLAFVPHKKAEEVLAVMKRHPLGSKSALIGSVTGRGAAVVSVKTFAGGRRLLPMLEGEPLPRIC